MKNVAIILIIAALPFAASCGSDDDESASTEAATSASTPTGSIPCLSPEQGEAADEYVGLDQAAAEALAEESGLTLRVVGEDGECFPITMDLREDRVNVEIIDGVVITAVRF